MKAYRCPICKQLFKKLDAALSCHDIEVWKKLRDNAMKRHKEHIDFIESKISEINNGG